jgi:hypothetical protein
MMWFWRTNFGWLLLPAGKAVESWWEMEHPESFQLADALNIGAQTVVDLGCDNHFD